jgi:hypothetical protein
MQTEEYRSKVMARSWQDHPRTVQNLHVQPTRHEAIWQGMAHPCNCTFSFYFTMVYPVRPLGIMRVARLSILHATCTEHFDAQDLPCLVPFGGINAIPMWISSSTKPVTHKNTKINKIITKKHTKHTTKHKKHTKQHKQT